MKNILLQNQKGFSLIEALIAMSILAIGLLAVGLMQIGAMKGNTSALSRADGTSIAQSVMDELRSVPMDDTLLTDNGSAIDAGEAVVNPAAADHTGTEIFGANPFTGANGQTFTIFWNVVDDTPVDNAKTVRVYVYWTDRQFGLNRSIMTSVIGGLYL